MSGCIWNGAGVFGQPEEKLLERFVPPILPELARMKQALNDARDHPAQVALRYERALSNLHHFSADRVEGLAAFKEKRAPKFQGK